MMFEPGKGKVRGRCPECRTEVWLTEEELGEALACSVCGTTFHVRRERKRRYRPGYWKLNPLPPSESEVLAPASRDDWIVWVLALLLLLLLALLFRVLGGSPRDDKWWPRRISSQFSHARRPSSESSQIPQEAVPAGAQAARPPPAASPRTAVPASADRMDRSSASGTRRC